MTTEPEPVDHVNDDWTNNQALAGLLRGNGWPVHPNTMNNHTNKMVAIEGEPRSCVDKIVQDVNIAKKLKPWYPGMHEFTFNDEYLQTLKRGNVTLFYTDIKEIGYSTERNIIIRGQEIHVNIQVLGIGFVLGTSATPSDRRKATIVERGDRLINDKWLSPDFGTLSWIAVYDSPNWLAYHLSGSCSTYNARSMYDTIACLSAYIIAEASRQYPNAGNIVI